MNKVPYLTHSKNAPQYNTYIGRIYGNTEDEEGIISSVKQITFQVTDDCNLCCTYCF
jgi:sulfatase maturation enzyme AslB (radical SAM superfamily)